MKPHGSSEKAVVERVHHDSPSSLKTTVQQSLAKSAIAKSRRLRGSSRLQANAGEASCHSVTASSIVPTLALEAHA
jgi:hypothetical protein